MYLKQLLLGWRFLFLIRIVAEIKYYPSCTLDGQYDLPSIIRKGDVELGGIFSMHNMDVPLDLSFRKHPGTFKCVGFNLRSFQFVQSMRFAIEEINKNIKLLPNLTLGYRIYDGCITHYQAIRAALSLITGVGHNTDNCTHLPLTPVIIGGSKSTQSIIIAKIVEVFNMPMISYFSTCACLSNKYEYPTFLRTIPSDLFQSQALAQLVKHFNWSWIGVITENNDYGSHAVRLFKAEAEALGICVSFTEIVPTIIYPGTISQIVKSISIHKAKVVLMVMSENVAALIFKEVLSQNVTGIQWIASESWATTEMFFNEESYPYFGGTIGFAIQKAEIPGLKQFLLQIHPSQQTHNPFITEMWEDVFKCSLKSDNNLSDVSKSPCTGTEDLHKSDSIYLNMNNLRISYSVYKAVYAVAHALHDMHNYLLNKTSSTPFRLDLWKLFQFLKNVNFTMGAGDKVNFDQNGDPYPSYDLVNWQKSNNGAFIFAHVGTFNKDEKFMVDEDKIVWQGSQKMIPIAECSESCPLGSRKAVKPGQPFCCFDCVPCDPGKISNQSNSLECIICPLEFWSNKLRDKCVPKELEYISFKEPLGSLLSTGALLGLFLTACVTTIFVYHRYTPLVRANNTDLSFCILLSIGLCFLSSITFLGQPTEFSCILRHTGFGITFALCISCILGKTIVVLVAFNVQHPDSKVQLFFSPAKQKILICLSTIFQFVVCTVWNIISPPRPVKRITYDTPTIILACDTGSYMAFSLVLGYIGILVGVCFTFAFCARNLPYQYNEAKFITFSMVIFSAVWITFIPSYLSSPGKYLEAVEMFAILCSSFGLLICIFAPKCYIMLLKPEKNNRKYMRSRSSS
ncbi:extracellular calcium-sensing receptor-like [Bombina bombina]|uniref:extracellular calcium-sensing receptor-like n=1 Tax=Bombina bombina TaxID=8345 RepID=UPI00235AD2DD|nr:extracellular calcium-sensing receptor-like [Bombina bombina]